MAKRCEEETVRKEAEEARRKAQDGLAAKGHRAAVQRWGQTGSGKGFVDPAFAHLVRGRRDSRGFPGQRE